MPDLRYYLTKLKVEKESYHILKLLYDSEDGLTFKDLIKFAKSCDDVLRHKLWALIELGLVDCEIGKGGTYTYYITDVGIEFLDAYGRLVKSQAGE